MRVAGVSEPKERMRSIARFCVLALAMAASATQLHSQTASSTIVVKAGRLLDPRSGQVIAPAAVLIDGDKIKQVGSASQVSVPAGAKVIDLGARHHNHWEKCCLPDEGQTL
jgi:hypothetical protein